MEEMTFKKIGRIWRFRIFNHWIYWNPNYTFNKNRTLYLFKIDTDFENYFGITFFNFDFLFFKLKSFWK